MDFFGQAKGWLYRNTAGLLKHRNPTVDGERCGQFYRDASGLLIPYNLAGKAADDCALAGSFFRDNSGVLRTRQPFLCDGGDPPACDECSVVPTKWTLLVSGGVDVLGFNDETLSSPSCSHSDFYLSQLNTSFDLTANSPGTCVWSGTKTLGDYYRNYTHKPCDVPACVGGASCADLLNEPVCDPVSAAACPCSCAMLVCCATCTCCHPMAGTCGSFCPCCCDCSTRPVCCTTTCPDRACCLNHYPPSTDPRFVTVQGVGLKTSLTGTVNVLTSGGIPKIQFFFAVGGVQIQPTHNTPFEKVITGRDCGAFVAGPYTVYRLCGASTCEAPLMNLTCVLIPS